MPYDPFGLFDDGPLAEARKMAAYGRNPLLAQAQGPPPLAQPEAESLLSKVANTGLGALHYVGGTIDKTFGGRAVRAAISGMQGGKFAPSELLSMLPFSDATGLTDESNRVSGEDILKQAGALEGDGQKGTFEMRDLAGPALELALDPSSYLTLGTSSALTAAGKAAKNAGMLPGKATARMAGFAAGTPELTALAGKMAVPEADLAGKALSGLAGFGLPFSHPAAIVGTGDTAKAFAGWLSQKAEGLTYGKVGTAFSRMFDPTVHNATTAAVQKVNREVLDPGLKAGTTAAYGQHLEFGHAMEAEKLLDNAQIPRLNRVIDGLEMPATAGEQAIKDGMDAANAANHNAAVDIGRPGTSLADDYIDYSFRQKTPLKKDAPGYSNGSRRELSPTSTSEMAREELYRNIPGGKQGINEIQKDATLRKLMADGKTLEAAEHVRKNHLGFDPATEQRLFELNNPKMLRQDATLTEAEIAERSALRARFDKAPALADMNHNLDPGYHANGIFDNHPLTDFTLGQMAHNRAQTGAEALHELIANNLDVKAGPGTMTAKQALEGVGLGHEVMDAATGQLRGGRSYLLDLLKKKDPTRYATASIHDLDNLHIPASLVEDGAKYSSAVKTPEALGPIVKMWDSITNLTRAYQTTPWPSFLSRNTMTGLWQNLVGGARDTRYSAFDPLGRGWLTPYKDAMTMHNNGVVQGMKDIYAASHPGIDDAAATRLMHEEFFQNSTRAAPNSTQASEVLGKGTVAAPLPIRLPGTGYETPIADLLNPRKIYQNAVDAGNGSLNPLNAESMLSPTNIRGVGARTETGNVLVDAGQKINGAVDELHRMASHIAFRRQGVEAGEATMRSKALHYDYSNLTDVEREVMRRIIPFYSWTRKNVPFQIAELAQRPGGVSGSAVKFLDNMRSSGGFVPDSVSEGMAIPVGKEDATGTSRFLTHFGLPIEDAFSMLGTGANPVQRTGEKLLGMANPLIKMPAEMIAGKQFYSGRALDDLYSTTGSQPVDQILMNSPAARFLTTGRQMMDPRKSILDKAEALLGPAKIADIDTNKARDVAARDFIDKTLKAGDITKSFETLYVPPDQLANMSPQEMKLYQLYKYMEKQRQAQSKSAKQNVGGP